MKCFCTAFVVVAAVMFFGCTNAALEGIDGLLDTAVVHADDVAEPVNRVLEKTGLSRCASTIKLSKYIGRCIPAKLKCVGIGVLDKLQNKLVNIPACKGRKGHLVVVQQQQQQQQS